MSKLRILHYSFGLPPKATGGLPLYVRDLSNTQKELGHEVNILLPKQRLYGHDRILKKEGIYYLDNSLPVSSIFGIKEPKDFIRPYSKNIIEKFLEELQPDVIHIHTFMGLPKELLEVAKIKKIKLVYTTHDYFGLCLKCNFIDANGNVCSKPCIEKCAKCNLCNGVSTNIAYIIGTDFYKTVKNNKFINRIKSKYRDEKVKDGLETVMSNYQVNNVELQSYKNLMNYYIEMFTLVDRFHFNSNLTRDMYKKYIQNINGKVVPITLSTIQDHRNERKRKVNEPISIGYIGRKEPYKGINLLINALSELNKNNINFNCLLYGDDFTKFDLMFDGKVKNMGTYQNSEINKVFNSIDLLIIPSICKETFGFIGLEALSYGVPVFFSENVGSKDLISRLNSNYIFNNSHLCEVLVHIIQDNSFFTNYLKVINEIPLLVDMQDHARNIVNLYF